MILNRWWRSQIDELARSVLRVPVCKEIVRRSGLKLGGGDTRPFDPYYWVPKGGEEGDVMAADSLLSQTDPNPTSFDDLDFFRHVFSRFFWHKPQYRINAETPFAEWLEYTGFGGTVDPDSFHVAPEPVPGGTLEDGPFQIRFPRRGHGRAQTPVVVYRHFTRTLDYRALGVEAAMNEEQLMLWKDVPSGTHLFPFDVDWFVAKRDLSQREGQYVPRQICLQTCVVEGTPAATLKLSCSPGGSAPGSWSDLVSLDLSPGGPLRSGWLPFPEEFAGDVWLVLRLTTGGVSRLHLGPIEALMRWAPRNTSYIPTT